MARHERIFVCQSCGAVYGRWQGKCDACGGWNTVAEENAPRTAPVPGAASAGASQRSKGRPFQLEALQG
ncbi:MAG: DNA repair protein RadA, partial [Hyphomicrobiales bacterium]|nr:DNA repair protein RadA [Hyphomicrobiales bacterium]